MAIPMAICDGVVYAEEHSLGLRETIDDAIKDAQNAFDVYTNMTTIELRKNIIANIKSFLVGYNEELSKMAVFETKMGRVEDKIAKNKLVLEKTIGIEINEYKPKSAYFGDYGTTFLNEVPFGIIGCTTPSTNPVATVINNSITMLSSGNIVVFNVHPFEKNHQILQRC